MHLKEVIHFHNSAVTVQEENSRSDSEVQPTQPLLQRPFDQKRLAIHTMSSSMNSVHVLALLATVVVSGLLQIAAQSTAPWPAPSLQVKGNRISADNTVLLMLDHQTGLLNLVRDYSSVEFMNNVLALAATAKLYNVPTILATSLEQGPNGPILPEIREMFPNATLIRRPGEINAWDNTEFVNAVKATGRKKLLIAGIVTDVCVLFPTLSALAEGYEVYVVVDTSGTFNQAVREAALGRAQQAGAVLINWFAVACELQKDWRLGPNSGAGLANLLAEYLPEYGHLITSHTAASGSSK